MDKGLRVVEGKERDVDTEVVGRASCGDDGKISIIQQHHHDCGLCREKFFKNGSASSQLIALRSSSS